MADRTYNALDVDLWDKDWGELAISAAAMLIGTCPRKEGIFDFPGGRIRRFLRALRFNDDEISAAFLKLVEVGLIKFYREGKIIWIVKKFKREARWVQTVKQREGVRNVLRQYPEIEPEFQALYGDLYLEQGLALSIAPSIVPIIAPSITSDTDTETEVLKGTNTKEKRETPITPPNKLRAPTERERQLFPLVDRLESIINLARADLGLAPLTQDRAKASIVMRQCYDKHHLQPKQLLTLAEWMFSGDNKDRQFNLQNLSLLHNWRKPWAGGIAIIVKLEEFLIWLQKQPNSKAG